jgi:thiol:disulfide interchange protein
MTAILPILIAFLLFSPVRGAAQAWDKNAQGSPAASAQVVRDGPVEARLVAEPGSVEPGKPFRVALVLTMDPEWHTYWKYPGESGLPTTLEWDLPPGFSAGPLQWPVPERFVSQGLVTFGYSGRVLLMSEITPPPLIPKGAPFVIRARAGWLACRVECTPGKASLETSLSAFHAPAASSGTWASAFADAGARLPVAAAAEAFSASMDAGTVTLVSSGVSLPDSARVLFYPSEAGMVKVSAAQSFSRAGDSLRLRIPRETGSRLDRLQGLLVTTPPGPPRAFVVDAPVTAVRESAWGLLAALLLAFAGGLILNLMPCVLPVLSLKVISFLKAGAGGAHGSGGLRHGLQFSLGVLVSFWIIAGILAGLRAGGRLLGWGFQFQDPAVVLVAAVLFFLIGLNLFGVFEVGSLFTRLAGALRARGGTGAFLTGVFATAVATPCTAPFMGAAVGYALSHSIAEAFGVFTALGLGMAAPSLALYASPRLGARLPKPGAWMETFRQVMAFPMMAAAVWMASVLAALSGATAVVVLMAVALAAGLGSWIWGRWGALSRGTAVRAIAGSAAILLAVGSTAAAAAFLPRQAPAAPVLAGADARASAWEPWSAGRVEELRKAGTPVFVDFSAQWCLTCLVNERVALDNPAVRARFQEAGVATLRADWTDTNDQIARGLASFGRASVPLYVFYPRGGKDPVILPEILTPGIVLAAIADRPGAVSN